MRKRTADIATLTEKKKRCYAAAVGSTVVPGWSPAGFPFLVLSVTFDTFPRGETTFPNVLSELRTRYQPQSPTITALPSSHPKCCVPRRLNTQQKPSQEKFLLPALGTANVLHTHLETRTREITCSGSIWGHSGEVSSGSFTPSHWGSRTKRKADQAVSPAAVDGDHTRCTSKPGSSVVTEGQSMRKYTFPLFASSNHCGFFWKNNAILAMWFQLTQL